MIDKIGIDIRKYTEYKALNLMKATRISTNEIVLSAVRFDIETGAKIADEGYELTIDQLKQEIADIEKCLANKKLILADVEKQIIPLIA